MKTKELIHYLQAYDPTGETPVCIGNLDIFSVRPGPAYWDGILHQFVRNEKGDMVGYRITNKGKKIDLQALWLPDVLLDHPDLPVEIDVPSPRKEELEKWIENERAEARKILEEP